MNTGEDDDFIRKYERFDREFFDDAENRRSAESELREVLAYLIERRHEMHDATAQALEAKARRLADELMDAQRQRLLAELLRFRDLLELHRLGR